MGGQGRTGSKATRPLGTRSLAVIAWAAAAAVLASAPASAKPGGRIAADLPRSSATAKPAKPPAASPAKAKGAAAESQTALSPLTPVMRRVPNGPDAPLTLTKRQDLQFGKLVMVGTSGSVLLPAAGLPVYSGLVAMGGSPTTARFELSGRPHQVVQLQLVFPVSGTYGQSGNARLTNLTVAADYGTAFKQTNSTLLVKLDSGGMNAITIGGKLTLSGAVPGRTDILFPITATVLK